MNLYQYHNDGSRLLQPDIKITGGGLSMGYYNGKEIILSPKKYEKLLDWDVGIKHCQSLDIDGHKDWYLPDMGELEFIYI